MDTGGELGATEAAQKQNGRTGGILETSADVKEAWEPCSEESQGTWSRSGVTVVRSTEAINTTLDFNQ